MKAKTTDHKEADKLMCAAHWMLNRDGTGWCKYYDRTTGWCPQEKLQCPYNGRHENKNPRLRKKWGGRNKTWSYFLEILNGISSVPVR